MQACGVHWRLLGGSVSLPETAAFDLPFARSDDEYSFRHWLASALGKDALRFGGQFFYLWRGVYKVS